MWAVREGFGDGVYMRVWDQVSVPRGMSLADTSISRSPEKRNHTGNIYSHTHFSTLNTCKRAKIHTQNAQNSNAIEMARIGRHRADDT